MTANLELFRSLAKTDPKYTKSFKRPGGFEGTAISPMWAVMRMTETFGPIGQGWGIHPHATELVRLDGGEVMIYACVSVWYGDPARISGPCWGGDTVVASTKNGLKSDDEAFKKASTDAMMKCLSYLGIGADIHLGLYDDSKYVNRISEEFREARRKKDDPLPRDPQEWTDEQRQLAKVALGDIAEALCESGYDEESAKHQATVKKYRDEIGEGTWENWSNRIALACERIRANPAQPPRPTSAHSAPESLNTSAASSSAEAMDDQELSMNIASLWTKVDAKWNAAAEGGRLSVPHLKNRRAKRVAEWTGDLEKNTRPYWTAIYDGLMGELGDANPKN